MDQGFSQGAAFNAFHCDKKGSRFVLAKVKERNRVWMIELCRQFGFGIESANQIPVDRHLGLENF